jgi:hypothetical protein
MFTKLLVVVKMDAVEFGNNSDFILLYYYCYFIAIISNSSSIVTNISGRVSTILHTFKNPATVLLLRDILSNLERGSMDR